MTKDYITAEVYLHIKPEFNYTGTHVVGAKVVKLTQSKPDTPTPNLMPIKARLLLDKKLFEVPEVTIQVNAPETSETSANAEIIEIHDFTELGALDDEPKESD